MRGYPFHLLATATTCSDLGVRLVTFNGATGANVMVGIPGLTTTNTLSPASPVSTGVAVIISSSLMEINWLSWTVTVVVVVVDVSAGTEALPGPVVAEVDLALVTEKSK